MSSISKNRVSTGLAITEGVQYPEIGCPKTSPAAPERVSIVLFCSCCWNVASMHLVLVHPWLLQFKLFSMKLFTKCSDLCKDPLELPVRSFPHALQGRNNIINLSVGIDDIKASIWSLSVRLLKYDQTSKRILKHTKNEEDSSW